MATRVPRAAPELAFPPYTGGCACEAAFVALLAEAVTACMSDASLRRRTKKRGASARSGELLPPAEAVHLHDLGPLWGLGPQRWRLHGLSA